MDFEELINTLEKNMIVTVHNLTGKVTEVNKISNKYATVVLGFYVKWGSLNSTHYYDLDNPPPNDFRIKGKAK